MCYDISFLTKKKEKYEKRYKSADISRLNPQFDKNGEPNRPTFHTVGFAHDPIPVIVQQESELCFDLFEWGLIPTWVDSVENAVKLQNNTLNARSETVFEKPAFRASVKKNRCLVVVDGFYEHQHIKKTKQPHFICLSNGMPFSLAGIWEEWYDEENDIHKKTVSILTTSANSLMAKIHNNPKLEGPRMPVILPESLEKKWLQPINDELDQKELQELLVPYSEDEMQAWPVRTIRGKNAVGNVHAATEPLPQQGSLF